MKSFEAIIQKSLVCLGLKEGDGQRLVTALVGAAVREGALAAGDKDAVIRAVLNRELSASTALADGVALPHGRADCVGDIVCVFGVHPGGIEFGAPDGRPTHVFVLLLVPTSAAYNYIHFLAKLSRRLMEPSVRNELLAAKTREDVVQTILSHSGEEAF